MVSCPVSLTCDPSNSHMGIEKGSASPGTGPCAISHGLMKAVTILHLLRINSQQALCWTTNTGRMVSQPRGAGCQCQILSATTQRLPVAVIPPIRSCRRRCSDTGAQTIRTISSVRLRSRPSDKLMERGSVRIALSNSTQPAGDSAQGLLMAALLLAKERRRRQSPRRNGSSIVIPVLGRPIPARCWARMGRQSPNS